VVPQRTCIQTAFFIVLVVVFFPDSPASSVATLLSAAALLGSQLQRGVDLPGALQYACGAAYSLCQRTPASQRVTTHLMLHILYIRLLYTLGLSWDRFP